MSVTLLLHDADASLCVTGISELAELAVILHEVNFPDHHPQQYEFIAKVVGTLDSRRVAELRSWSPVWGPFKARYLYPLAVPLVGDFAAELAAIASLSAESFADLTFEAIIEGGQTALDDPGSGPGRSGLLKTQKAQRLSSERGALAARIAGDPLAARDELVALLRAMRALDAIDQELRRVRGTLQRRAFAMQRALQQRGLSALTEISPTVDERYDPHRLVFDKKYSAIPNVKNSGLILLPSEHVFPHLIIKHASGYPVVIHYSLQQRAIRYDLILRRIQALDDPTRTRILRNLLRQPRSTRDLAQDFRIAESQISRHLRKLKDAGLVTAEREGRLIRYRVNTQILRRLGVDFIDVIIR